MADESLSLASVVKSADSLRKKREEAQRYRVEDGDRRPKKSRRASRSADESGLIRTEPPSRKMASSGATLTLLIAPSESKSRAERSRRIIGWALEVFEL